VQRPAAVWTRAEVAGAPALAAHGFPERAARLLARRGPADAAGVRAFLAPTLESLHPAHALLGLSAAVERLAAARRRSEKVAIVGDYDVDGIAATALLAATLRSDGVEVETVLPRRDCEGYGFQPVHVERAAAAGCRLLVTVDCGIQSFEGAGAAARRGLDLIVTDHHLPGAELPRPALIVNPRQPGCSYPFRDLTGAGLALKLAVAYLERAGREVPWPALLRIACLGTIADVAPLVGENRVIAALGLAALADARSPGLRALLGAAGVQPPVRAADVGYRIGPRLNAAGRLGAPDPALEVLLTRDPTRAAELVEQLGRWNAERQAHEATILSEARAEIGRRGGLPPVVVAWSEGWHKGVVGVAAGRLARELHRPVLLLAVEGELATGSGRSVEGISLHGFVEPVADQLERFGGHDQAIGLTARKGALVGLRSSLEEAAATWDESLLTPRLEYDDELDPDELVEDLWSTAPGLEPFGAGNPEPLFRIGPLRAAAPPRTFGNRHLSVRVAAGTRGLVDLVGWGWAERGQDWSRPFEVLAHLDRDRMRGGLALRLVDARPVASAVAP